MGVQPGIRFGDELFIEPFLASAGFAACDEQDGPALSVECEGDTPLTVRGTEAELFHIGVAGIVQRVDARTPQLRAELLQEPGVGQDFDSYVFGQLLKFRLELVADFDVPCHHSIMTCNTYGVKIISG